MNGNTMNVGEPRLHVQTSDSNFGCAVSDADGDIRRLHCLHARVESHHRRGPALGEI